MPTAAEGRVAGPGGTPRPRVFLHVGSPKTGTTFLQNVLWSQRDEVARQGVLLPLTSLRDHYMATLDVRGLTGRAPDPKRARGLWDQLAAEALAWPGTVLVSHELLSGATEEQARRALDAFDERAEVHVVLTARDLVRQIPAEWQEHVKHRNPITYAGFLADISGPEADSTWFWRVQDLPAVLRRWGAGLPPDRCHVVTVPPPGSSPELLWQRFAGLVGLRPETFDLTRGRSNTSLGVEQTELLRRLNSALDDRLRLPAPYAGAVKEHLAHRVLSTRPGSPLRLPVGSWDFALDRSERLVKELTELEVDVVGSLTDLMPVAEADEPAALDPSEVPESVLLTEAIEALIGLIEQHVEERSPRPQAQRRIAELTAARDRIAAERDQLVEELRLRDARSLSGELAARWRWAGRLQQARRRLKDRTR